MTTSELKEECGLTDKDFWSPKPGVNVISHDAIIRVIAKKGLKITIEKTTVVPIGNDVYCECVAKCENVTEVGSAHPLSLTSRISRSYPSEMAYKRATDRAVIRHLGLDVYSDAEADEFTKGMIENVRDA